MPGSRRAAGIIMLAQAQPILHKTPLWVKDSKVPNIRIYTTVCTDRHDDDEVDATQNCRMSEYVELCARIGTMMILMQLKIAECQIM